MQRSILSQAAAAGGDAGDDIEPSCVPTPTLERFESRRKALLKFIHRQTSIAQRFIFRELDLQKMLNDSTAVSMKHHVSDKHHKIDPVQESASSENEGGGDSQTEKKQVDASSDDDEDLFELGWTMRFDSVQDFIEYKRNYVEQHLGALDEYNDPLQLSSQSQTHITLKKVGSGKYASSSSLNASSSHLLFPEQLLKPDNGLRAKDKLMAKVLAKSKTYFSSIPFVVGIPIILGVLYVLYPLMEVIFNFIDGVEWPWLIFMREPMIRGFFFSSSHFKLFRYRTEDDLVLTI